MKIVPQKLITIVLLSGLLLPNVYAAMDSNIAMIDNSLQKHADFPKQGVSFYDVSGILANPAAFQAVIDNLVVHYRNKSIAGILALDARGFLFATPLAYKLQIPVVMLRKPGRLPGEVVQAQFTKEYGVDTIEMQKNLLTKNTRVIIVDDLLATGGTLQAAIILAKQQQLNVVECATIVEIEALQGKSKLDVPVYSIVKK